LEKILALTTLPTPSRALLTDDPVEVLNFARAAFAEGDVAVATLVEIHGGAARSLGSQVVVASDGRFCGYVSGGCVEAAVAAEALLALEEGCDRMVKFGDGSPFIDIVLPCGGGITIAIHVLREIQGVLHVLDSLRQRQSAALCYSPQRQSLEIVEPSGRANWKDGNFLTVYHPDLRIIISGQTVEAQTLARLAESAGYQVIVRNPAESSVHLHGAIDSFTAVVLLHHDLEQEEAVLGIALRSPAFYIGALGSAKTHRRRTDRLTREGFLERDLQRIKGPIGIFGPTRDSASLALSVLAEVAATKMSSLP
jgi:xanthine dehydrogenase accessory factor